MSVLFVCAARAVLSEYHWKASGVQAAAVTLKPAFAPTVFVWLCGSSKITGGVWSWTIISFVA